MKLPLVCDIDGVLLDIVPRWYAEVERRFGIVLSRDAYKVDKNLSKADSKVVYDTLHDLANELYQMPPTRPWIFDELLVWQERTGREVVFCTYAPPGTWQDEAFLKLLWLQDHAPAELKWSYAAVADSSKCQVIGCAIVEDCAEKAVVWADWHADRSGCRPEVIVVAQPWNASFTGVRISTQKQLAAALKEIP